MNPNDVHAVTPDPAWKKKKFTVLRKRWDYAFVTVDEDSAEDAFAAVLAGGGEVRKAAAGEVKMRIVGANDDGAYAHSTGELESY